MTGARDSLVGAKLGVVVAGLVILVAAVAALVAAASCACRVPAGAPPTVSGTTTIGGRLRVTGGPVGLGKLEHSRRRRRWLDCDSSGRRCSAIGGATQGTYVLRNRDLGHTIRAAVTVVTRRGATTGVSAPTRGVAGSTIFGGGGYGVGHWPPGNWDPYSPASPWNQQLLSPRLMPRAAGSADVIGYMAAHWHPRFAPQTISNHATAEEPSQWDHPLYWARAGEPLYTIRDIGYPCHAGASTACPRSVRIPDGAYHALGGDGHLAVVEPDGHTEIDFWRVENANPLSGGGSLVVHAYGALDLNGDGCCGGSAAANQGLEAGQIRAREMQNGVINHALSATVPCTSGKYVFPATGAAQACPAGVNAPADGTRLQLDMTDSQVDAMNVSPPVKIIMKAMIHYGLIVTDTGGSSVALQWEPALDYTSFGTANPLMTYLASQGFSDPATISMGLPWSDFQVVSVCYTRGTCY